MGIFKIIVGMFVIVGIILAIAGVRELVMFLFNCLKKAIVRISGENISSKIFDIIGSITFIIMCLVLALFLLAYSYSVGKIILN